MTRSLRQRSWGKTGQTGGLTNLKAVCKAEECAAHISSEIFPSKFSLCQMFSAFPAQSEDKSLQLLCIPMSHLQRKG